MKKLIAPVLFILLCQYASARQMADFKVSKVYCLLNFMETATNSRGTSATLRKHIEEQIPADPEFERLKDEFRDLQLDYPISRQEFPGNRRAINASIADLVKIAAVQSATLHHFMLRTTGMLPNSEHQKLISILTRAEPYYDHTVWNDNISKGRTQLYELSKYEPQVSDAFKKLRHFYRSSWSDDMPFTVTLYLIPGAKGNSTASPHVNSLCVGVFTDETDHISRIGVVLHEMCHVLYDEQPASVQHHIDSLFMANKSKYSQFAYDFFDEGMATALGNGWAYRSLNGTVDTGEWYNHEYINGFGHALYPMAERYIETGKALDKVFVDSAIQLFGKTFPRATEDYSILMNRVHIYADAADERERQSLFRSIGSQFRMTYSDLSTPIADEENIKAFEEDNTTRLFIIDRNHNATLQWLKKQFPDIGSLTKNVKDQNFMLSFFDKSEKPVILIHTRNADMLNKALSYMKDEKYISPQPRFKAL